MCKGVTRWMFYLYLIFGCVLNFKQVVYMNRCTHIYVHSVIVFTVKEQTVKGGWDDLSSVFLLKLELV